MMYSEIKMEALAERQEEAKNVWIQEHLDELRQDFIEEKHAEAFETFCNNEFYNMEG